MYFTPKLRKLCAEVALFAYIGFMVFGVIHLIQMSDMDMPMDNCPFLQLEKVLCFSGVAEHLQMIKSVSYYAVPVVYGYILFVIIFFVLKAYEPPSLFFRKWHKSNLVNGYDDSLYVRLFSAGILNGKAF